MANKLEIEIEQKRRLFMLLEIKAENPGIQINALNRLIIATEAEMEQENVAWVREKIAELHH